MLTKLKKLIKEEDPKNPYTDSQLAHYLNTSRETVTKLRIEHSISDSRDRRAEIIEKEIIDILTDNSKLSERKLTELLNERGFKIARSSVNKLKKEIMDSNFSSENEVADKKYNPFNTIIGVDESLKTQINQAKASVLYPPRGLHTLITGPSGSGKSFLAKNMYEYAKTTSNFNENSPFEILNCADYADNPQLLLSQLFGHTKGAFTGAGEDKKGLVEICDKGILFLDEIHRLPPEGQEILFYLLDQKLYRRMGETELTHSSDLLLIGATTEDPSEALLLTFRRRIPIAINLPGYHERTIKERFEFIELFFKDESKRVGKPFKIKRDVIKSFLSYSCQGNIGQLKSDIQATSAKGFLQSTLNLQKNVLVTFQDLPRFIMDEIINKSYFDTEVYSYSLDDLLIDESDNKQLVHSPSNLETTTIYDYIENTYNTMRSEDYTINQINKVLSQQLDNEMKRLSKVINNKEMNHEILQNVIGKKAIDAAKGSFEIAKKYISNLDPNLFFPLSIHLNSAINRFLLNKGTKNPNLVNIKHKYVEEFQVATRIKIYIDQQFNVDLSEDEVGFIAMYLKNFKGSVQKNTQKIGVVVLSHGHVAKGMAEVANKLLGVTHAIGLEMGLTDSPNLMLEKTLPIIEKANQGKGVIILADMGSLILFGDIITARTGIDVRVIGRVDTLMVIESVRRSLLPEDTLEDIAKDIDTKQFLTGSTFVDSIKKEKAIITLCLTGEGAAQVLKNYIETSIERIPDNIEILPVGYFSSKDTFSKLDEISQSKEIIAIIGTVNLNYENVPFMSAETLFNDSDKLINIIQKDKLIIPKNPLKDLIDLDSIYVEEKFIMKNDVIDKMVTQLEIQEDVNLDYSLSVYKRETMGNTYLEGGIAIPHGEGEFVTNPAIVVTKLAKPIIWENNQYVDIIFMLALTEKNTEEIEHLYKVIYSKDTIDNLQSATSPQEIYSILTKNTI
ncbi:sigma 54-interacting transcriptional regulator [Lacticigenium naphthae]|uniref:sigma 54-interacting transcriptional regulator n=1 Tax=Lacticigenium naphthae TaxID=515351 RepID=UPI000403A8E8|nr:sigma 54-interacting transcriptional regulator [Lacticigenium naphthae]